MEVRARIPHVLYRYRCVKPIQNICDSLRLSRLNSSFIAGPLQSSMIEALDTT